MIRILIVDRIHLAGEALAVVLDKESDLTVIAVVHSAEQALQQLGKKECDLILANAHLYEESALQLIEEVKAAYPQLKAIVLGLADSEAVIMRYIEAGASGYTLLQDSLDELRIRIRATFNQEAFVAPEVAAALMDRIANLSEILEDVGVVPEQYDELTEREREILNLIATGLTNQAIADQLFIEVGTVKNHIHSIFDKLNVSSRKDAALYLSLLQQHEENEFLSADILNAGTQDAS
ncbi:MAG: response regulator transcription factor [Caldilineaceae bacterium]|nr:response regulator transcription factor [Caldilineaceae bacterium]